jgi:raffinose/stachyose/melibiose transport system permease protein
VISCKLFFCFAPSRLKPDGEKLVLALVVISDDALKTVPLGLVAFRGNYVSDWTAILASISVTSIPMLILFVAFQRQFIRSLAGSTK